MSKANSKVLWPVFPDGTAKVVLVRNSERNLAIVIASTRKAKADDNAVIIKAQSFGFQIKQTASGQIAYHPAQEGAFSFRVRALSEAIGAEVRSFSIKEFERDFRIVVSEKPKKEMEESKENAVEKDSPAAQDAPDRAEIEVSGPVSADKASPAVADDPDSAQGLVSTSLNEASAEPEEKTENANDEGSQNPVQDELSEEEKEGKVSKGPKVVYADEGVSNEIASIIVLLDLNPDEIEETQEQPEMAI